MFPGLHSDRGFSLTELTIGMTLGLVVLGIVFTILQAGTNGARLVNEDARATRDASRAMMTMSKFIREMERMETSPVEYSLTYLADRDDDGALERVNYALGGDRRLRETVTEMGSGVTRTTVMAENVRNLGLGVPVFQYYSSLNTTVPVDQRRTKTKLVRLTVITDVDPSRSPAAHRVQTDIYFRNTI